MPIPNNQHKKTVDKVRSTSNLVELFVLIPKDPACFRGIPTPLQFRMTPKRAFPATLQVLSRKSQQGVVVTAEVRRIAIT
jgi:hypothetical protein